MYHQQPMHALYGAGVAVSHPTYAPYEGQVPAIGAQYHAPPPSSSATSIASATYFEENIPPVPQPDRGVQVDPTQPHIQRPAPMPVRGPPQGSPPVHPPALMHQATQSVSHGYPSMSMPRHPPSTTQQHSTMPAHAPAPAYLYPQWYTGPPPPYP